MTTTSTTSVTARRSWCVPRTGSERTSTCVTPRHPAQARRLLRIQPPVALSVPRLDMGPRRLARQDVVRMGPPRCVTRVAFAAAGTGRHLGRVRVRQLRSGGTTTGRVHRRASRALRPHRLRGPCGRGARGQTTPGQLEGCPGGLPRGVPRARDPPAVTVERLRRQRLVRHLRTARVAVHPPQRVAEPTSRSPADPGRGVAADHGPQGRGRRAAADPRGRTRPRRVRTTRPVAVRGALRA